jgi:hypothetical protein
MPSPSTNRYNTRIYLKAHQTINRTNPPGSAYVGATLVFNHANWHTSRWDSFVNLVFASIASQTPAVNAYYGGTGARNCRGTSQSLVQYKCLVSAQSIFITMITILLPPSAWRLGSAATSHLCSPIHLCRRWPPICHDQPIQTTGANVLPPPLEMV